MFFTKDDSGEKVSILGGESIFHREKEIPTNLPLATEIDLLESTSTEAL